VLNTADTFDLYVLDLSTKWENKIQEEAQRKNTPSTGSDVDLSPEQLLAALVAAQQEQAKQ
jgi:hypothetical protein